jgi:general stress protein 26
MDKFEKLVDMIADFDTAMLVTHSAQGNLDARPMAIAEVDKDGSLWFVTDESSGKMADLAANPNVALTMQGGNQFISIKGTAKTVNDRDKIHELWRESWQVWFPDGRDDPRLILLHILPEQGEYWDNSGLTGVKYLLKAGRAYLQGERPTTDAATNATVRM